MWISFDQSELSRVLRPRMGETKLGESLQIPSAAASIETTLAQFTGKWVLIGMMEDLGVLANEGIGGADTAWMAFLQAFLHQHTTTWAGEVLLLGYFDFRALKHRLDAEDDVLDQGTEVSGREAHLANLRKSVECIDEAVFEVVSEVVRAGKLPILLGGGHNNAFPLIKAAAMARHAMGKTSRPSLNVFNLDAHTDFRPIEGRHSGNGFRYAYEGGWLGRYAVFGLQEAYNAPSILREMQANPDFHLTFWETLFVEAKLPLREALDRAILHVRHAPVGLELDVDCIENVLSSAMSPFGFSLVQVRQIIQRLITHTPLAYVHITEAVALREDGLSSPTMGKLLATVVRDVLTGLAKKAG